MHVDDLIFSPHARRAMGDDQITEAGVYDVVNDADEILERDDGRTELVGVWRGRTFVVLLEDDGETVVTV